jgi:osomolarity two-component system sensor histidine kinase SLN1
MASLPSTSFETTAPVLARMAVQDAGASPTADAVSLNLEHPDTAVPREPDTGTPGHATPHPTLLRDHQPPPIALPARTSAAFFSNIARRASTSTPGTPPSATSSFAITSVPPSAGSASGGAGATEKPAPPFPGMPVLVVDDDSLTRMLMKRLLTRLGCKVSTAENGEAALALLTGSPRPTPASENAPPTPDRADGAGSSAAATTTARWSEEGRYSVVFLDNQMPVLSGLEAVHKLRQAGHRDFVVGVTGEPPA